MLERLTGTEVPPHPRAREVMRCCPVTMNAYVYIVFNKGTWIVALDKSLDVPRPQLSERRKFHSVICKALPSHNTPSRDPIT